MSLSTGRDKLHSSMKTLRQRWDETRSLWDDLVSQELEETFWAPLESQVPAALRAIDQLDQVLRKVRNDCA